MMRDDTAVRAELARVEEERRGVVYADPMWDRLYERASALKWVLNDSQTGRFDGGQDEQSQH